MRRRPAYDVEGDGDRNNFEIMQLYWAGTIHSIQADCAFLLSFLSRPRHLWGQSYTVSVRQEPSDAAVLSDLRSKKVHHNKSWWRFTKLLMEVSGAGWQSSAASWGTWLVTGPCTASVSFCRYWRRGSSVAQPRYPRSTQSRWGSLSPQVRPGVLVQCESQHHLLQYRRIFHIEYFLITIWPLNI